MMDDEKMRQGITRREFISRAGLAGAAIGLAPPIKSVAASQRPTSVIYEEVSTLDMSLALA